LEYLINGRDEVRGVPVYDVVLDAYLWAHLWGVFMWSDLMDAIEMRHFGVDGFVAMMSR